MVLQSRRALGMARAHAPGIIRSAVAGCAVPSSVTSGPPAVGSAFRLEPIVARHGSVIRASAAASRLNRPIFRAE